MLQQGDPRNPRDIFQTAWCISVMHYAGRVFQGPFRPQLIGACAPARWYARYGYGIEKKRKEKKRKENHACMQLVLSCAGCREIMQGYPLAHHFGSKSWVMGIGKVSRDGHGGLGGGKFKRFFLQGAGVTGHQGGLESRRFYFFRQRQQGIFTISLAMRISVRNILLVGCWCIPRSVSIVTTA